MAIETLRDIQLAGSSAFSAGGGPIALSQRAPAGDQTITAGYSAVVCRKYTIASGTKLSIGLAALFKVLGLSAERSPMNHPSPEQAVQSSSFSFFPVPLQ